MVFIDHVFIVYVGTSEVLCIWIISLGSLDENKTVLKELRT